MTVLKKIADLSVMAGVALLMAGDSLFAQSTAIELVAVGNANNPGDSSNGGAMGAVSDEFRMGRYEITNAQYAAFLNAKAALGDSLGLFNTAMQSNPRGGIFRSGVGSVSNPFVYLPKPNMMDKPVNHVGWYDCVRFINWLHNGQNDGATETGAYVLLGGTAVPSNAAAITRRSNARFWLPNNNEWHKAALYEPGASGNSYWNHATRSDNIPTIASATAVGDIANPGTNVVNYIKGADWNGQDGNVTTVGSAGLQSRSYYGTYDQYGNVFEWCENLIPPGRARRGGSWVEDWNVFFGGGFGSATPTIEIFSFGIRVASVPCATDIAGDGDVNVDDLLMVIQGWGKCDANPCDEDIDQSGTVDAADLLAVINSFGVCGQ